jgi:transposase
MNMTALPDDITALKNIIADLQTHVNDLEAKMSILRKAIFGPKSEKIAPFYPNQLHLFLPSSDDEPISPKRETDAVRIPEHNRKKPGRRPLPPHLPRVEVIHDLPDDEKVCGCSARLTCIGQEVSEKLDIVPAKIQVIKHIRLKYACRSCEGVESEGAVVKTAEMPPQIISQGIVSPSLLAHIIIAKFIDALPFYRQEKQFARMGIDIARATMSNWTIQVATACFCLIDLLLNEIRGGPIANMDETTLQVLNEPGRANTTKSYLWAFRGGALERPAIVFHYATTRSGTVASDILGDKYQGFIQTDGYAGYDAIGNRPGVVHVGCLTHARRKFIEVLDAGGKKNLNGTANQVVDAIRKIYTVEHKAKDQHLDYDGIRDLRQQESRPILEDVKRLLDERVHTTPPKSLLGKAIAYTLGQWQRLNHFLDDGRLRPDNNIIENDIRPIAVGRKNWLFCGDPSGAKASATFFSLIATAKANGIDPAKYFPVLFDRLPCAKTIDDLKALLPQYIDRSLIA